MTSYWFLILAELRCTVNHTSDEDSNFVILGVVDGQIIADVSKDFSGSKNVFLY